MTLFASQSESGVHRLEGIGTSAFWYHTTRADFTRGDQVDFVALSAFAVRWLDAVLFFSLSDLDGFKPLGRS